MNDFDSSPHDVGELRAKSLSACERALNASLAADETDHELLRLGIEASHLLMMMCPPVMHPPPYFAPYPPDAPSPPPFMPGAAALAMNFVSEHVPHSGRSVGQQMGRDAARPRGDAFTPTGPSGMSGWLEASSDSPSAEQWDGPVDDPTQLLAAFASVLPMATSGGEPHWGAIETTIDVGFRVKSDCDQETLAAAALAAAKAIQECGVSLERGAIQFARPDGSTSQVGIQLDSTFEGPADE